MWKVIRGFIASSYGRIAGVAALAVGLMLFGWWAFRSNPAVQTVKTINPNFTQELPRIGNDLTFTDSTGQQTTEDLPEDAGDVEQTMTVEDSSGTRRLFVEQTGSWFPEITGRPTARVRGLSMGDVRGVTVTNQTAPLLGFDTDAVMVGGSYGFGGGPSAFVAYQPIQVWAFRFGPSLHLSQDPFVGGSVSVEVRESLHLVGAVSPDVVMGGRDKQIHVGLAYNF